MKNTAMCLFALWLLTGCAGAEVVPTQPDAGADECAQDGGVRSRVHGDCDSCEERCRELARDALVVLGECLRECSP